MKWRKGVCIGEGSYARVYQAQHLETFELFAVKEVEFCMSMSRHVYSHA